MSQEPSLQERIARIEDRQALRELASQYNFSIDDRDLDTVATLFTENAYFGSHDGAMGATGRQAIIDQFRGRFAVLGATNHFSHDQVVRFESPTRARGQVASHAEVWRNGRAMVTALRYSDLYDKSDGQWRFAERRLSFMYYVDIKDYPQVLGVLDRNRAGPTPQAADWPENTPSFRAYMKSQG